MTTSRSKLYAEYLENPSDIICPDRKEDWICEEAETLLPFLDDYIDSFQTVNNDKTYYNEGILVTDLNKFKTEREKLIEIYGADFAKDIWIVWSWSLEHESLPYLIKRKRSYGKKKHATK